MGTTSTVAGLAARVSALESSQRIMSHRLEALEASSTAAPVFQTAPPPPTAAAFQAAPPPPPPPSPSPSAPAAAFAPTAPEAPPATEPTSNPVSIESLLRYTGAILIGLAAVFLVGSGISRGWITPELQLLGATALGAAFLAVGLRMRDSEPWGSTLAIVGTGIVTICASAGHSWLGIYGPSVGLALTSLAAVAGALAAIRLANQWVATAASLTLLLIPTWAGIVSDAPVRVVGLWLVLFTVATTAVGLHQRWTWYRLISGWSAALWLTALIAYFEPSGTDRFLAFVLVGLTVTVLWLNPVLGDWRTHAATTTGSAPAWDRASSGAVPLWAWLATSTIIFAESSENVGRFALILAAFFVAFALLAHSLVPRLNRALLPLQLLGALILATVGALVWFEGSPEPVVFMGLAVAALAAAQSLDRNRPLRVAAMILAAVGSLGIVAQLVELAESTDFSPVQAETLSVVAPIALAGLGAWFLNQWDDRKLAELSFGYLALATSGLIWAVTVATSSDRLVAEIFLLVTVALSLALWATSRVAGQPVKLVAILTSFIATMITMALLGQSFDTVNATTGLERLAVLAAIVALAVGVWQLWPDPTWRGPTLVSTWILSYLWVLSAFLPFDEGQLGVSIVWAAGAVGAIWFGVRQHDGLVRTIGLVSLGVVVVKLLTVDLAEVDTLWRVLLFLVIGLGLLRLAYVLPSLAGQSRPDHGESPPLSRPEGLD